MRDVCCRVERGGSGPSRRAVITTSIAAAAASVVGSARADETAPTDLRPQPGDRLAFFTGDHDGKTVVPDLLPLGGPSNLAYPMDPKTGVIRNGAPFNLIAVARFKPEDLGEETRARSADGVVAYSGICTHQGCPVSMWQPDGGYLFCSCHGSEYDPRNAAQVMAGPAPAPVAALPLKTDGGFVVVAGAFTARLGPRDI